MTVFKGENSDIYVGVESTQGTTVTPSHVLGKIDGEVEPPDPESEWEEKRYVGTGREAAEKFQAQYDYSGSIPVQPVNGRPLAYLMGSDSVNVDTDINGNSSTGTDTHVITAADGIVPPTQTLEVALYDMDGTSDFVRTFNGCVPPSGELSLSNDNELSVDMDYIAMGVDVGSTVAGSGSLPDVKPWTFDDTNSNLTMFGQSFARLSDFNLTIENGAEPEHYIAEGSGRDPLEMLYGNASYELTVDVSPTDKALYNELVNPTAGGFTAEIEFQRPNGDRLRITGGRCNVPAAPHPVPEDSEKVEVSLELIPETLTIKVEDQNSNGSAYL